MTTLRRLLKHQDSTLAAYATQPQRNGSSSADVWNAVDAVTAQPLTVAAAHRAASTPMHVPLVLAYAKQVVLCELLACIEYRSNVAGSASSNTASATSSSAESSDIVMMRDPIAAQQRLVTLLRKHGARVHGVVSRARGNVLAINSSIQPPSNADTLAASAFVAGAGITVNVPQCMHPLVLSQFTQQEDAVRAAAANLVDAESRATALAQARAINTTQRTVGTHAPATALSGAAIAAGEAAATAERARLWGPDAARSADGTLIVSGGGKQMAEEEVRLNFAPIFDWNVNVGGNNANGNNDAGVAIASTLRVPAEIGRAHV